ncbi:MAG TPA: bifunctional riboflavin kinase/FAD synthetase [Methylomusa anaerophila]|uniref:Riboflavin biosynthesis protein n=1 Tax=Methylomusa anaerophila TaxID=1930071 RepID=A0A348APY5_9FIRM|nr:bifunctional riboflavin kinase/FAD synthetase [Methylomusa anaerophila]BBB93133.1 riboflavin biosynthesis protein RibF [Methylomusa anaerophila]HML87034.1 bifunctional riboflavin kinase/FAD synthetase [Methylomusa anaerophila]
MKVFTHLSDIRDICDIFRLNQTVMALGTFDGVHVGHKRIISHTAELARVIFGTSVVFTFSNHPLCIIDPERCPSQIITAQEKARLIEALSINIFLNIPFTEQMLHLSPDNFISLLLKYFDLRYVIIGSNYTYGFRGAGTAETLCEAGIKHGFKVEIIDTVCVDGLPVSSTAVRQLIAAGDIKLASKLLGRVLTIEAQVIKGDGRGRTLGYPTANLSIPTGLLVPKDGVYAVRVLIEGIRRNAIANIGANPTFTGSDRRIEVYILDYSGDLYGRFLLVEFVDRIRDEIAFSSVEQLTTQIASDISVAQNRIFSRQM